MKLIAVTSQGIFYVDTNLEALSDPFHVLCDGMDRK